MFDGRKWKTVPFIVLTNDFVPDNLPETVTIVPPYFYHHAPWAIATFIKQQVDDYQEKLLGDFEWGGWLIRFESGHIQISNALKRKHPSEESRFYRPDQDLRPRKARWFTFKRDGEGLRNDVEIFRQMLDRKAGEEEMHLFFERNPQFLMEAMGKIPQSHQLRFDMPEGTTTDYTFHNIAGPYDGKLDILELKGSSPSLLTRRKLHAGFTHEVHNAVNQVRDYGRYMDDPRNYQAINRSLRYIPRDVKLAVLIGRTPHASQRETFGIRQAERPDVTIITYDDVFEHQAKQIDSDNLTMQEWFDDDIY